MRAFLEFAGTLFHHARLWFLCVALLHSNRAAAELPRPLPAVVTRGHDLFVYEWQAHDVRCAPGDGLGPIYNERSCVACHYQGGTGGTSGNQHNVVVKTRLAVGPPAISDNAIRMSFGDPLTIVRTPFQQTVHRSIMLHRFGTSPAYEEWRKSWSKQVRERPPHALRKRVPRSATLQFGELEKVPYFLSQRSAPALFGASQIDRVPASALFELAETQRRDRKEVSGEVARVGNDVGRFGWRGQTAHLFQFVGSACANELGLQVDGHQQTSDPLDPQTMPHFDLATADVEALTAFVEWLPSPISSLQNDGESLAGKQAFERIGCVACHAENALGIPGLYSDLLLHDLGPRLADAPIRRALPLPLQVVEDALTQTFQNVAGDRFFALSPADYLGAVANGSDELVSSEWRTPPLWGIADTAPYLHDGRASSLEQAIEWHGGEASGCVRRYRKLATKDRQALIHFLQTLHSPDSGL